ncbi:DUF952 domain-containing protein [Streptomyces sp. NPDC101213]|uniref:DUF952 domain-containing protein n=1 Tax=Streptomyces sp. NPDC101213 TaxID=3366130 RepID=UPI00381D21D0
MARPEHLRRALPGTAGRDPVGVRRGGGGVDRPCVVACRYGARRPAGFPAGIDPGVLHAGREPRHVHGRSTPALVVAPARLEAPVRYEALETGAERFPQVYGPIPVDAVTRVEPWR